MQGPGLQVHIWNIQIKGSNAAEVWKQLVKIHAQKGDMFQTDLLNKLQTMRYIDGNNMKTHLGAMKGIWDRLAETESIMTDDSFNKHIWTSLFLTTHYRPLFTTLNTTACITKFKSQVLI